MTATSARVDAQSTRDALGGVWATSLTVWAILLVPAVAVTAYQASADPYPNALVRALAILAPCLTPVVVVLLARLLRSNSRVIPLVACVVYWVSIGVVHGLTAALLSVTLSGSEAQYPAQAIFWGLSSVLWVPLVTYVVARFADRRRLLTALQDEIRRDEGIRRGSLLELADLRSSIVGAIQDNIRPVLVAIAESLSTIRPALDGTQLTDLGTKLAEVSEETARIIETTANVEPAAPPSPRSAPATPLGAALEFDRTRPFLGAALGCLELLPLIVAVSLRTATVNSAAIETELLIVVVIGVLLLVGSVIRDAANRFRRATRIRGALGLYLIAGLAGGTVALVGPWQPASQQNLWLALMLPIAVPFAASTLSAGVGFGNANLGIAQRIRDVHDQIAQFERTLEADRNDIRQQVSSLTHGPLRGRLAACAMALNFHAAEIATSDAARTEFIVTSVREHLSDVLEELDSLR